MEIERINDHTIKFFIPFQDIESRGFSKDEILFLPDRGEELFWEVIEEVSQMSEIKLENPLWIQVHVTDLGLEVIATGIVQDSDTNVFEQIQNDFLDGQMFQQFEKILDYLETETKLQVKYGENEKQMRDKEDVDLYFFTSFEDVIQLSCYANQFKTIRGIYFYEERYYLVVSFSDMDKKQKKNLQSILLEFGELSRITYTRLKEYGKCIGKTDGLHRIQAAFFFYGFLLKI